MRGVSFFCYARMYSGNSARFNKKKNTKNKLDENEYFLEVCVAFNLSQISLL